MPAIYLPKLRQQCAELVLSTSDPAAFLRILHTILEIYADRAQRSGQAGLPAPLINAYHVPKPVLNEIRKVLLPSIVSHPEYGIKLSAELWKENVLEIKHVAADILGMLPITYQEQVLSLIKAWLTPECDPQLIEYCLRHSLKAILSHEPESLIQFVHELFTDEHDFQHLLALRILQPIILSNIKFLPLVYRLLTPYVRSTPEFLRADLLALIQVLARESPHETAFFLIQLLSSSNEAATAWLIRQSLGEFPIDVRDRLRVELREKTIPIK